MLLCSTEGIWPGSQYLLQIRLGAAANAAEQVVCPLQERATQAPCYSNTSIWPDIRVALAEARRAGRRLGPRLRYWQLRTCA